MALRALVVVSLALVCVALYVYTPLPDDIDQRGFLLVFCAVGKVSRLVVWLWTSVSHVDHFTATRFLHDVMVKVPALDSDPHLQVTNEIFSGIPVRVYRPKSASVPTPVLIFFHGGGWVQGSIDAEDASARYLARQAGVAVVSVGYRLAPDHPFPAALDDCLAATVHVLTTGTSMGLDSARVGVIGTSAGGNLAAAVSLRLLDPDVGDVPGLACQVVVCACLQGMDLHLPSYVDNDPLTGPVLSVRDMATFYLAYSGVGVSREAVTQIQQNQHIRPKTRSHFDRYLHGDLLQKCNPPAENTKESGGGPVNESLAMMAEPVFTNHLFSPLLAPTHLLKRLPRVMVVMSHYDVLRDDSMLYVTRLRRAGAEVTSHLIANGQHVSIGGEPRSQAAKEAYARVIAFIRESVSLSPDRRGA